jgi:hypothetical protein
VSLYPTRRRKGTVPEPLEPDGSALQQLRVYRSHEVGVYHGLGGSLAVAVLGAAGQGDEPDAGQGRFAPQPAIAGSK